MGKIIQEIYDEEWSIYTPPMVEDDEDEIRTKINR